MNSPQRKCVSERPYGVVRCTSTTLPPTGKATQATYDNQSLYVVPCNVTLNHVLDIASGSVNSTLKVLPALMVLTSFPHILDAKNVSTVLSILEAYYPKAEKANVSTFFGLKGCYKFLPSCLSCLI